jgi:hypothetical protein
LKTEEKEFYFDISYDKKGRFASYWHQIQEIIATDPQMILEIGVGSRFVSNYLAEKGYRTFTLDINKELWPSICGSVINSPCKSEIFDVVACCEVLEHLSYQQFTVCLKELNRLSKDRVLIAIPDSSSMYRFWIQIPLIGEFQKLIRLPFKRELPHIYDGHHFWEIGRKGFSLERIMKDIRSSGFEIIKTYRVFEFFHRFFVLKKVKKSC